MSNLSKRLRIPHQTGDTEGVVVLPAFLPGLQKRKKVAENSSIHPSLTTEILSIVFSLEGDTVNYKHDEDFNKR